ncbi:MAG TPA: exodeoxyribonuclease VII large subunit, partial [Acidimicrobiales bacterium]|nr:exodeoxyribonuclease VII large subunit [Acidimicrobiales bacterium]
MTAERTWTIGDLNRRASRAVVLEFRGRIWTVGELAKLVEARGNRFMELVERGGGRRSPDAHLKAFCSATRWAQLSRKLAEAGVELRVGQRVVVAGCLEIGDRGELSLVVDDVDIDALVGDRLRTRRELVQRLKADDLFDANRRMILPRLPLRVGVVASAGSDGHRDLMRQLEGSGFAFAVTLRSIAVEGPTAPRAIQAALATLGPADVDVAVLVRGGGAKAS